MTTRSSTCHRPTFRLCSNPKHRSRRRSPAACTATVVENGIGNHWVTECDVVQHRFALDHDSIHHRVTVVALEESKWVNLFALSPRDIALVWVRSINGGNRMVGSAALDPHRRSEERTVHGVDSAGLLRRPDPGHGPRPEGLRPASFLVSNKWIPLRCVENVTEILIACTAAGAVLPTDPCQPIDVITGAPLQSPVRIRHDQDVPYHTVESGVLNTAQLQHFMLPSSVFGHDGIATTEGVPLKVIVVPGHSKSTFKTRRTPASDAEVWFSVDSLTDPDMGFRVAGTYAAPGEILLTAAVDEDTTAPASCEITAI